MRQIWITKAGAPGVLQVKEAPDPEAGPGELRIKVSHAGINFADIMARMGQYQDAPPIPCVVGYEVSGEVDQLGEGVEDWSLGQRVVSFTRFSGYSSHVVVPAHQALPIPEGMTNEKAAAIPVNYITAWLMLYRLGNVQPGDTVLVHSLGGGVGIAALQLCAWRGAKVIGTASAGKHQRLKAMGAAHCVDYRTVDFEPAVMQLTEGRGVDLVLDAVGGRSFRKSYRCLGPNGRLYMFGASSSAPGKKPSLLAQLRLLWGMPWFHPIPMLMSNRGVQGVNLGHLWEEIDLLRGGMDEVLRGAAEGVIDPVVDQVYAFDEAAQAHMYIQERQNFGKVLLAP